MDVGRLAGPIALGLALLHGARADAQPARSEVVTPPSSVVVDVHKRGLFSPFLHDHHLRFREVHGSIVFDPQRPEAVRGELVVNGAAFADEQPALSAEDRAKVEAQIRGPEILDVRRFGTIRVVFSKMEILQRTGSAASGSVRGTLLGTLELRGQSKPIRIPMAASYQGAAIRATGATAFRQSAFGIEPYSTGLGTVGIEDRVDVRFDLVLRP